jgi:hypothetical protein
LLHHVQRGQFMPRGGWRTGSPGASYSNRTDLNRPVAPAAASGQQYGKRAEQMAAQRAMPIAPPPTDAVPTASPPGAPPATQGLSAPPGPLPGQVVPLDAPSARPGEPVTAGLPVGAGAGPEALGPLAGMSNDVEAELRAIYSRFPNEDVRSMLEFLDD